MSAGLIGFIALVYAAVAIDQAALKGNAGWALMYAAYAVGNIGAIMALPKA